MRSFRADEVPGISPKGDFPDTELFWEMNWKDLFYFTRAQRNGILVLLILIVLVILAPAVYQRFYHPPGYDDSEFLLAVTAFEAKLDSIQATEEKEQMARASPFRERGAGPVILSPFPFNPNQLPAEAWEQMGVPAYVARSIKNYEYAGGQFRFKEDVSRLYLMTDEMYSQLEPYIQLPSRELQFPEQGNFDPAGEASSLAESYASLRVELNSADTTELVRLYGIGPTFSRRIVGYREKLGGYVSIEQLLEVYGMDSLRLAGFRGNLLIDTSLTRKININQAEWAELVQHPYISSNLANSIVAIRKQHGPYQSIGDIRRSHLVNDEIFKKIAPYLSIE